MMKEEAVKFERIPWRQDYLALMGTLERRRRNLGWTQKDAAAAIGISEITLRRAESSGAELRLKPLFRLGALLGVRIGFEIRAPL